MMDRIIKMPVSKLLFDFRNPRLVEFNEINSQSTEEQTIKILWEAMDVRELVLSIAASGYFNNEPLIVSRENGRHIVLEGNRRLAAVKRIGRVPELNRRPGQPALTRNTADGFTSNPLQVAMSSGNR